MTENLDDILNEIEQKKHTWDTEVADPAETANKAQAERREKVAAFQLNMDLDGEFGEYTPPPVESPAVEEPAPKHAQPEPEPAPQPEPLPQESAEPPAVPEEKPKKKKKRRRRMDRRAREMWGCAGSIFYVLFIIGVSLVAACVLIMAALDLTGLNKPGISVKVTIEENTTAAAVADTLAEHNLIDHKWFFKLYANVTGEDSEFKSGVYTLSANMGYGNIVDQLRAGVPRTVVNVTIPEGYTIDGIAALMEENAVCTKKTFYDAVLHGDYSDYSFVAAIPKKAGDYAGMGYALEGYLFPDTYEFYTGSTGETVVRKLLDNFDNRVDTTYKTKIAAQGMTIHEVVTLASIVQAEAAAGEWSRVSRVLTNRLNDPANYPRLQCDATISYYKLLDRTVAGLTIDQDAYDTAVRKGLPPGAIANPGMRAINAVLNPSEEEDVAKCFFFATDFSTGITYYSKTYAQHQAICNQYNIGGGGSTVDGDLTPDEMLGNG